MNSAIEYLGMAALLAMRSLATTKGLPRNRAEFVEEFINRYDWKLDGEQAEKALAQLHAWGYVSVIDDRYAGEALRFTRLSSEEGMVRALPESVDELFGKARLGGIPWFSDVFGNKEFWEDLANEVPETAEDFETSDTPEDQLSGAAIPASDRVVRLDDNRPAIELLAADLRGISEEVRENNEAAVELGDEKDLIQGELRAAEILIEQPAFRLQRLYVLVLPALRFLAEKFATGAIGEMAKRIISMLLGMA